MTEEHRKHLRARTSRLAGVSAMLMLFACILAPLFLRQHASARFRGFLVYWFVTSLVFNLVWQLPNVCIAAIRDAAVTHENLPWAVFWWAYTLSDTHYSEVTPFMVSTEVRWLLGNLVGVAGLWMLHRGRDLHAHLFLGLCGALQAYIASLYMFSNGIVDRFENVPPDPLAHALYWGLNGFWTLAAASGSVLSFRLLMAQARVSDGKLPE